MSNSLSKFLVEHEHEDPIKIVLANKSVAGHSAAFVANQLDCRKRAKDKLPTWYANPEIIYPPKQNLEQCSSETTALIKCDFLSTTINQSERNATAVDLTGGFGVDTYFFSKRFNQVIHVEPDYALSQLAKENHLRLGATNITYQIESAEDFLLYFTGVVDVIYIDPSRKFDGKKLVRLSDCQPNVLNLLQALWSKTNQILIKAAPLLDIKEGLQGLPQTAMVTVVSVANECREVLFYLKKDYTGEPNIICINQQVNKQLTFEFQYDEEAKAVSGFSEPNRFIYEPNASILKAGAFKKIGQTFGLSKLAVSTHLYTHLEYIPNFPGRVFKVLGDIAEQRLYLPDGKANVISRNHPLNPPAIQKKYKLQDGGERYVIACSSEKKKHILIAERLQ